MYVVPLRRESRPFSRLFDDTVERFLATAAPEAAAARRPALDVAETEQAYSVKLDMPGVTKDDVKVSVEGRQVTVQAQSAQAEDKVEGERLIYRERSAVRYARSFTLPAEVDQSQAVAKLDQGVLTLTLPKRSANTAHITVN